MSVLEAITAGFELTFKYVDSLQEGFEISGRVVLLNMLVHYVLRNARCVCVLYIYIYI